MVHLRHFTREDIPFLQEHGYGDRSHNELCEIINRWATLNYDGAYFEMFAVCNGADIVGNASLYQTSSSIVSCGMEIYSRFRNTGYAAEAYEQLLGIAKEKGYAIATAQVRVDNEASIKLCLKLGFETDNYEYANKKGDGVFIYLKSLR